MALATLVIRIALILIYRSYRFPADNGHFSFGMETGSIARSLATGEGFASPFTGSTGPTAWLAPVYPCLVAAVFKLFGVFSDASGFVILSINSVFAALTCLPLYHVGRRTVGRTATLWAGWLWALAPHFAKWPVEWVWEVSLSALLAGLAYWMTLLLAEAPTRRRWLTFGLLWGVMLLTNPSLATLLPFALAWLAVRSEPRRFARDVAVAGVLGALVVAPWLVRNRVVLGQWVFIRDNFGFELHFGNYHESFGMGWRGRHPSVNPEEYRRYVQLGELRYVAEHQREAVAFIRQYPREFAALCGKRFAAFWDGTPLRVAYHPAPWTPPLFFAFSLLAAVGLLWALAGRVPGAGLYAWLLVYPLPYYLTYPQPRYRHAVDPEMLLLACFLVADVAGRAQRRFTRAM